jgi:predicted flap endonuclease-1-like 5' DNA nuclease
MPSATTKNQAAAEDETKVPKWIESRVLPATDSHVKSLHLLKESGLRNSALLFTDTHAYVAEKGTLTGVKLYEVDYPGGLFINGTDCPHCGETIREPVRKVATVKGGSTNGRAKASRPKARPTNEDTPRTMRTIPAGKEVPVEDIEGIGSTYLKRLEAGGITTTDQLLAAEVDTVVRLCKAPEATVRKWYGMAELMRVKGIGKQFSELLVRSGVRSIRDLAQEKPAALAKKVNDTMESVDVTIQGAGVSDKRAANWIREAKKTKTKQVEAVVV